MSRLNTRAIYQLAVRTQDFEPVASTGATVRFGVIKNSNPEHVPDPRVSGRLAKIETTDVKANDAITVSQRAYRQGAPAKNEGFDRTQVMTRLGFGALGLIANAYMEQERMTDEEIHSVQQRFYGLSSV